MDSKPFIEDQVEKNEKNHQKFNDGPDRQLVLVDDEDEDVYLFKRGLEELKLNYTIHHARSGDEMFSMLEEINPDYIFLDIFLPGKSGIACLKMLRNNKKYETVPIIIYSKFIQPSFIDDCYLAKATYFVVKTGIIDNISSAFETIFSTKGEEDIFPQRDQFFISPKS